MTPHRPTQRTATSLLLATAGVCLGSPLAVAAPAPHSGEEELSLGRLRLAEESGGYAFGGHASRGRVLPKIRDDSDLYYGIGAGTSFSPDTLLLSFDAGLPLENDCFVGGVAQLGATDDEALIATSLNVGKKVPLPSFEALDDFALSFDVGAGAAFLSEDNRRGDDEDIGLLLNLGFGGDFQITERMRAGTSVRLNFLPGEVLNEDVFVTWQIVRIEF